MGSPNPFLVDLNVTFNGPGGTVYVVPGFYDGDGAGGMDGDVWKVRFSPDSAGTWTYETASPEPSLDGLGGNFEVTNNPGCQVTLANGLPDFDCAGRLEYAGEHYLKFNDGPYWLKGGVDEPEDFLAAGKNAGFSNKQAAVDYLAGKGVNSMYLMLTNIDGDDKNVWPWVGTTQDEAKTNHERFDITKLAAWEELFAYIQEKGMVLHIVFEDDSAWTGFNREMFYREMVARFGHHNGMIWNIGEEYNETYYAADVKIFAQILRDLDPYDHPLTVHQQGTLNNWLPFLGDARFDLTSFQTGDTPQNVAAVDWFNKVEGSGRVIPVSFDEATLLLPSSQRDLFRHILWSIYTGGANYEMFTKLSVIGFPEYEQHFEDMRRARELIEDMPYWDMQPVNPLVLNGDGYLFAKPGAIYLTYLPNGGEITLDLSGDPGVFNASWFNPRVGSTQVIDEVQGGGPRGFSAPDGLDWALLLEVQVEPTPTSTPLPSLTPTLKPTNTSTPLPTPLKTKTPTVLPPNTPTPETPGFWLFIPSVHKQ
jgi:hypothetical protein